MACCFDINDFDETLPGPWEWDIKRLAASVVIAAHHLRLADSDAAKAATDTVCSYRERMTNYASMRALEVWYDFIDMERVASAAEEATESAEARERVERRIEQARKSIPETLFPKLAALGAQLLWFKEQILEFDRLIMAWHLSNETSRRLDAIPGIGPALATALVGEIRKRRKSQHRTSPRHRSANEGGSDNRRRIGT